MLSLYKLEHFLGIKMKDLFWKSVCVCVSSTIASVFIFYSTYLQYQPEHQAWSVGGSSGSRGSW